MGIAMPLPVNGLTESDRHLLDLSAEWTMCSGLQKQFLMDATRYVERNHIPGSIVECGVWRGGMMQIVARTLLAEHVQLRGAPPPRELWLYDTFHGMPEPTSTLDRDLYRGEHAAAKMAREDRVGKTGEPTVWCVADLSDVRDGMRQTGYPTSGVVFVEGLVEDAIPERAPSEISILRVDTDWYTSTNHILRNLYDKISPGGILILDDYDSWEGAKVAADEFFAERGIDPLLIRLDKGRVLIKG